LAWAALAPAVAKLMRQSGLFELVAAYDVNGDALQKCQTEDGAAPTANSAPTLSVIR
jgi:hypothetical protein